MIPPLILREFDTFHAGEISRSAFAFFREKAIQEDEDKARFISLTSRNGRECLQVKNYVGVVSAPDGSVLEILPKHTHGDIPIVQSRQLLWKMLGVVHDIPFLSSTDASLETHEEPLPEVLVTRFLREASHLVHRGLRSDYLRKQDTRRFLKGRLCVSRQLRMPPTRLAEFCIDFDEYSINRSENRLVKAALEKVLTWKLKASTKRTAKELLVAFANVTSSGNYVNDFRKWRKQRDMAHYQPVKPWLELILNDLSPWAFSGPWKGISMLFRMEELFELYVEKMLRRQLARDYSLAREPQSEYLVRHDLKPMFQLRPDLLIRAGKKNCMVLDTKWKLLDQNEGGGRDKYNINQADMYQLYAYGQKYLRGKGNVVLIYPRHALFSRPLPVFSYDQDLDLWAVPFDLDKDELILPNKLQLLNYFPEYGADKGLLLKEVG